MGEIFAGRYELLEPVAEGGMGTVWTVVDRDDGQFKAAKILRQSDAASLLRFVREQSMRIDHQHVVTPLSWAGMDDRVLFTMPLVRGGSVHSLLSDFGRLPLRWIGVLLDQTLQALEAVHGAGIVHRDVKPANLLLEPTGRARPHLRLTDFGIAAPVDQPRMTQASMAIGSPGYMAPEQWHGSDPDPRQDLYSVGLVGLEMLTGVRPGAQGQITVEPDALDAAGPQATGLVEVLRRASSADPLGRPATAAELRRSLADLGLEHATVVGDDDVEVFDHFADHLGAPAPSGGQPTPKLGQAGSPSPAEPSGQAGTPAPTRVTYDGHAGAPALEPTAGQRPRRALGLVLLVVGVVSLLLAAAVATIG